MRGNSKWESAIVVQPHHSARSYSIHHNSRELRRNRKHLMPTTMKHPPLTAEICTTSLNMQAASVVSDLPDKTQRNDRIWSKPPADVSASIES